MRSPQRAPLLLSTLLACVVPMACDSKPSVDTTMAESTVKGVVKIDGKPANGGEIYFDASNYQRQVPPRMAQVSKEGTYEIKALQGQNSVKVGGAITRRSQVLQMIQRTCDVKSGENTFDFEASAK